MSLKTLLMLAISACLLSRERLLRLRQRAEASRRARGEPHQVQCFLQVDDPYSALLAQALPRFLARYHVRLVAHVVGPPLDSAVPERALLVAHSRRDAQLLATAWGLAFTDTGRQPAPQAIERATRQLVAAIDDGHFLDQAGPLLDALWRDAQAPGELGGQHLANAEATRSHLAAANALRQSLGHYLGGMLYCAGEWYWGIDRLHHLEQRLQDLGAQCEGVQGALFPTDAGALDHPTGPTGAAVPPVDFFFSLRSPYSAIVAPRVFALGQQAGAAVRLRYVLPMVMRGLAVPAEKRRYISQDAAREAHLQGTPFGRLNDPVSHPTERGLALIPLAERQGLGQAYVGDQASLATLMQHAGSADVLHLACHAQFRGDNPMFSALHLHDGPLTAERAEGLALRPGVVVLSACETGLAGQAGGDDQVGLVRAFLVAGAARVLASLWPVDDAVTARFMAHFYGALQQGLSPAQALGDAQTTLMAQHPHPAFWAGFVLFGGW